MSRRVELTLTQPPITLLGMNALTEYLDAIRKAYAAGDATEHTHRPALKHLLESLGKEITVTNEPKRTVCGSPDFQITRKGVRWAMWRQKTSAPTWRKWSGAKARTASNSSGICTV